MGRLQKTASEPPQWLLVSILHNLSLLSPTETYWGHVVWKPAEAHWGRVVWKPAEAHWGHVVWPQWAFIKKLFLFEICSLPNPRTSKSFCFEICSLPNPRFQIRSLQNPFRSKFVGFQIQNRFASKCVHFQIHSLRKFVHFQIHYLCTFKSTHFEICSLPIHSLPISFSAVIVAVVFRNLQN